MGNPQVTICGLMSWFDEDPAWIYNAVRSLTKAGVTALVAIDGRYGLYDSDHDTSPAANHEAVVRACRDSNIRLLLDTPTEPWNTEVDKRSRLFALGDTLAPDWFLVMDADQIIDTVPTDLHARLGHTDLDVAEVTFHEPHPDGTTSRFPIPILFRATPGIRVRRNHYTYLAADGTVLWGRNAKAHRLDTRDLTVQHLTHFRQQHRRDNARSYYRTRDRLGIEIGQCEHAHCDQPGTTELPHDWRLDTVHAEHHPEQKLTSTWISVCADCEPIVRAANDRTLRSFGLDPATVQVTFEKVPA
jgi:hypothetical protein